MSIIEGFFYSTYFEPKQKNKTKQNKNKTKQNKKKQNKNKQKTAHTQRKSYMEDTKDKT